MDPSTKIALVPFVQGEPTVHLLDQDGKASAARDRSPEDDFQMAAQSLGVGPTNESAPEGAGGEGSHQIRESSAQAGDKKAERGGAAGSGATTEAASPPEHPLQKAITSFDMALGELNQLVHLVDLARAGEFMVLKRVTPAEEDQARAMPDHSASPGDGVPSEALPTMVTLKRSQLKGAAKQLRKRAKRLRETTKVQKVFQQGVMHLRKSWRIVAPNHGKVNVPLQVGEALCVDCSFGSAGGRPVPNTAAAGSRHRHPWLFQLTCSEGGQLKAQPSSMQHLKAFEVLVTGACEHSLRASFPACGDGSGNSVAGAVVGEEIRAESPSVSNGGGVPEVGGLGDFQIQMNELEQHISRQQHSVFWEEVFETLKSEALVDGKDGWLARQDARCRDGVGANRRVAPDAVGRVDAGAKRRLVSLIPRGTTISAGARVVHVLDDEVMVEMNSNFQLGYKLVSGKCSSAARAEASCTAEKDRPEASERTQAASLCQLALLYCGSLILQQQRAQVVARRGPGSNSGVGREVGARIPAGAAGGKVGSGRAGGHWSASSTWKAVRRVLLHHLFRSEVIQGLANVSRTLQKIGLPLEIVLTFGDITAAWTSSIQQKGIVCFRVDLVPASIHLLPVPKSKGSRNSAPEEADGEICEVRVFVEEVGIQIACRSRSTSRYASNGEGCAKEEQAGVLEDKTARQSELSSTVAAAPGVHVAEWDRLGGQDLFRKFSSLLAELYPL
eukprot:g16071.t1